MNAFIVEILDTSAKIALRSKGRGKGRLSEQDLLEGRCMLSTLLQFRTEVVFL